MNRNNIWIHIGLAVVLITLAAVLGQLGRWQGSLRTARTAGGLRASRPGTGRLLLL